MQSNRANAFSLLLLMLMGPDINTNNKLGKIADKKKAFNIFAQ